MAKQMGMDPRPAGVSSTAKSDPDAGLAAANSQALEAARSRFVGGAEARTAALKVRNRDERGAFPSSAYTPGMYTEPAERARLAEIAEIEAGAARNEHQPDELEDEESNDLATGEDDVVDGDSATDEGPRPSNLSRAREALKATGLFSDEMLAKMSRSQILRAGRKAERKQSRAARQGGATSDAKAGQPPALNGGQATSAGKGDTHQSHVPASSFDRAKLSKHFEGFDDATKEALESALSDVISHFESRIGAEPASREPAQDEDDPWEEARDSLSERWPEIGEDDVYDEIKAAAAALATLPALKRLPESKRYEAALTQAARAAGLEVPGGREAQLQELRRSGRASAPNSQGRTPPRDPREAAKRAFLHLGKHPGDVNGARRAGGLSS